MAKICFDLDGVICNNTYGDDANAFPFENSIKKINQLYNEGNYIIIFTARFSLIFKNYPYPHFF